MGLRSKSKGQDGEHHSQLTPNDKELEMLRTAGVPAIHLPDPCRTCDEPCPDWPDVDIDHSSALLGSTNPFARLVICATEGKDNWVHSVTDEAGSFEHAVSKSYTTLSEASSKKPSLLSRLSSKISLGSDSASQPPGLGPCLQTLAVEERPSKITILSGSNYSRDAKTDSFLVFPDFKVVHGIAKGNEGAQRAVEQHLLPSVDRFSPSGSSQMASFPLPYRAVILICSHKNRDKRCAVTAPPLISEFKRALEAEDLGVDEHGEVEEGERIESWSGSKEECESKYDSALRESNAHGDTVGIFKVSHFGGHKFAGNVYVCLPSGACMLYGRVTVTEVEAIVKQTILEGKVIQEMLRGGVGLSGRGDSLLSW